MNKHFFISGIDTDCGKTYITARLAKTLRGTGVNCITSKFIQTGCTGVSEDIEEHRRVMEMELLPEDVDGTTCPIVYTFPASPHLSSQIDNKPFDLKRIEEGLEKLKDNYEILLTEGAGGLTVPLTEEFLTSDYLQQSGIPVVLVTSSKLGSINHTILSVEFCRSNNINLMAVVYNEFPDHEPMIAKDSYRYMKKFLEEKYPDIKLLHSEAIDDGSAVKALFS